MNGKGGTHEVRVADLPAELGKGVEPLGGRTERGLKPLITNAPFLDSQGAVGGYFVVEADDLDAAIEQASRIPAAHLGGAIEIRPSATYW
jgi:hypothetical protein